MSNQKGKKGKLAVRVQQFEMFKQCCGPVFTVKSSTKYKSAHKLAGVGVSSLAYFATTLLIWWFHALLLSRWCIFHAHQNSQGSHRGQWVNLSVQVLLAGGTAAVWLQPEASLISRSVKCFGWFVVQLEESKTSGCKCPRIKSIQASATEHNCFSLLWTLVFCQEVNSTYKSADKCAGAGVSFFGLSCHNTSLWDPYPHNNLVISCPIYGTVVHVLHLPKRSSLALTHSHATQVHLGASHQSEALEFSSNNRAHGL